MAGETVQIVRSEEAEKYVPALQKRMTDEAVARANAQPEVAPEPVAPEPTVPMETPLPEAVEVPVAPEPMPDPEPVTDDPPKVEEQTDAEAARLAKEREEFHVARGRLRKQTVDHKRELEARDQKFDELTKQVESLRSQATETPVAPFSKSVTEMTEREFQAHFGLSDEQMETYGEGTFRDLVGVAEKAAGRRAEASDKRVAKLERRLDAEAGARERAAEDTFYKEIGAVVEDWVDIDKSDEFQALLGAQPALRQTYENALALHDPATAAGVFRHFQVLHAPVEPIAPSPSVPSQVAPRSTTPLPPRAPKPVYSQEQIEDGRAKTRLDPNAPGAQEERDNRLAATLERRIQQG